MILISEPFLCKHCKQMIIFHEGVNRVINWYDGPGGEKGDKHMCPHRRDSDPHHKELDHQPSPYPGEPASTIFCPFKECNIPVIEEKVALSLAFAEHLIREHDLSPSKELIIMINRKVEYLRKHNFSSTSRFLHVSMEDVYEPMRFSDYQYGTLDSSS